MLSLCVPSRHAALFDHGESIGCNSSVPSPMTLAFALNQEARHSRDSHHPLPMGVLFVAHRFTLCCGLSSCSPPFGGSDRAFARSTGAFTPELPASWSPFSPSGITTVVSERFHRWDIHPLERQLASLHWPPKPWPVRCSTTNTNTSTPITAKKILTPKGVSLSGCCGTLRRSCCLRRP